MRKIGLFSISCLLSLLHDQDPRSVNEWLVASKYEILNITFSWGHLLTFY